jgi:hypothetical protein
MGLTKARSLMVKDSAVNLRDFGAVGDGVTDDTTAVQAAWAHCVTNKVALYIPTGIYNYTSLNNAVPVKRLFGDGDGSVLRYTGGDANDAMGFQGSSSLYVTLSWQDFTLKSDGNSTGRGISFDSNGSVGGFQQSNFTNIAVFGFGDAKTFTDWANATVYAANDVVLSGGVLFQTTTGGTTNGTYVADDIGITDWTEYSPVSAWHLKDCWEITLTRCDGRGSTVGWLLNRVNDVSLISCNARRNAYIQLDIGGSTAVNISGGNYATGSNGEGTGSIGIRLGNSFGRAAGVSLFGIYTESTDVALDLRSVKGLTMGGCRFSAFGNAASGATEGLSIRLGLVNASSIGSNWFREVLTAFQVGHDYATGTIAKPTAVDVSGIGVLDVDTNWIITPTVADWSITHSALGITHVGLNGAFAVPNATWTPITWGSVELNQGFFDSGNPTRLTIPANSVVQSVEILANIDLPGGTDLNEVRLRITKNGVAYPGCPKVTLSGDAADGRSFNLNSGPVRVVPGNYFEVEIYHNAGVSINISDTDYNWVKIYGVNYR